MSVTPLAGLVLPGATFPKGAVVREARASGHRAEAGRLPAIFRDDRPEECPFSLETDLFRAIVSVSERNISGGSPLDRGREEAFRRAHKPIPARRPPHDIVRPGITRHQRGQRHVPERSPGNRR